MSPLAKNPLDPPRISSTPPKLHRHRFLYCGYGGSVATGARGRGAFNGDTTDQSGAKNAAAKSVTPTRQLSWTQVEVTTGGFTLAVGGEGGFSIVYLAPPRRFPRRRQGPP